MITKYQNKNSGYFKGFGHSQDGLDLLVISMEKQPCQATVQGPKQMLTVIINGIRVTFLPDLNKTVELQEKEEQVIVELKKSSNISHLLSNY